MLKNTMLLMLFNDFKLKCCKTQCFSMISSSNVEKQCFSMISTSNVEKHDVFQYARGGSLDVKGKGSVAGEARGRSLKPQDLDVLSRF